MARPSTAYRLGATKSIRPDNCIDAGNVPPGVERRLKSIQLSIAKRSSLPSPSSKWPTPGRAADSGFLYRCSQLPDAAGGVEAARRALLETIPKHTFDRCNPRCLLPAAPCKLVPQLLPDTPCRATSSHLITPSQVSSLPICSYCWSVDGGRRKNRID